MMDAMLLIGLVLATIADIFLVMTVCGLYELVDELRDAIDRFQERWGR